MGPPPIDLRSDTVTRPTPAMREAMARAEVGDDLFGEDPSINRLQERVAELLGHEAGLWMPSGTMADQVAIRTVTRPGDEMLAARDAHVLWYESGGTSASAGVQVTEIGPGGGRFGPEDLRAARKPAGDLLQPPTTLVSVENTHNRAGGVIWTVVETMSVVATARDLELTTFLDGARIWNAAAALGVRVDELARPFDLVSVAFSKGLGAPGGSMLVGSSGLIDRARRYRKMAGGAMRQVGFFAAAAEHALDHHLERLVEDHANARLLVDRLADSPAFDIDPSAVQTNIVVFRTADDAPDAPTIVARAREAGVLVVAFNARTIRAVTHLDVTRQQVAEAAEHLVAVAESPVPA
jgi:threonine aldolase